MSDIPITIKISNRAKHIRLVVSPDKTVVVISPLGFPRSAIEKFVQQKTSWILKALQKFDQQLPRVPRPSKREYQKHKERARQLVAQKLRQFNALYDFPYKVVTIRNQTTRWASCSKRRNLNFSYRVVFLEESLLDYLIVHELCHLSEFNHSHKFWDLVAQAIPDWRSRRKQLRLV